MGLGDQGVKTYASIVAEEMMTRSSGLFLMILDEFGQQRGRQNPGCTYFLSKPSKRSVYAPLSCASSIYTKRHELCPVPGANDTP